MTAARACRAAVLELGDGAEPGAGCSADGFGLGKGFVVLAVEAVVGTSPHRAALILQPGGRELGFGAAPHLGEAAGSEAQSALKRARWDGWMCCKRTSCSSSTFLSPAASDGQ